DAFTFANMTMASAGTKTVKFTKSTTYTMTGSNFLNGTAGNLITVDSDDGATQWTLSKSSGMVVADYVSMNRSNATGGASFYLTANSTMTGSTGWVIDNTPPTNPTTFNGWSDAGKTTPITTGNFYNYPSPHFEWDGATDAQSGVAGYWVYFGTNEAADPALVGAFQTPVNYTSSAALSSGSTYYFRIRTKDNAGNLAASQTYFTYKYDSTAPNPPAYIAATPSGYTSINNFSFNWPAATDTGGSGIAGYQYKRGNGEDWSATQVETTKAGIQAYQTGTNAFLVRSKDNAGNYSTDVQTSYYYTVEAPTKPTSLIADPESSATNSFTFTWIAPVHIHAITDYGYTVNQAPTTGNLHWLGSAATTLGPGAYATQQGNNTFYLVAKDEAGNYALDAANIATVNFSVATTAPPAPANPSLTDTSNRAASIWELTLKWLAGAGQDPATFDHYLVERSLDGAAFSTLGTTPNTAYLDSFLSNLITYYYRIKSVDNAGNPSAASAVVSKTPTGNYLTPPTYVGQPAAAVKASQAIISWITNRGSSSFVKYAASEADLNSADPTKSETKGQIDAVTSHSITITGLKGAARYYYKVLSYDSNRDYNLALAYSPQYDFLTANLPSVAKVQVTNIKLTTADIAWETSVSATTSIQYGTNFNYGSTSSSQAASYTTQHTVTLENLSHSTTYHFRINGSDGDTNEFRSDDYLFTTKPLPSISNFSYQLETKGPTPALAIYWKTNVPTSSTVEHRPKDGTILSETSASDLVRDHRVAIAGLNDNTLYSVYVSGRDEFGTLVQSNEYIVKTADDTRPPQILNIAIETSNIGVGTQDKAQILVSWDTDEPATGQIEYEEGLTATSFTQKTNKDSGLAEHHLVVISELKPQSPYTLRILSSDKADNLTTSTAHSVVSGEVPRSLFQLFLSFFKKTFGWIGSWL
ncbi:fibronectin type III domain-containing protein, partial [Patescibacteria group bacterium]|nr:fibronectin type III domain-containing protein [Patescibacteria group bacterium]